MIRCEWLRLAIATACCERGCVGGCGRRGHWERSAWGLWRPAGALTGRVGPDSSCRGGGAGSVLSSSQREWWCHCKVPVSHGADQPTLSKLSSCSAAAWPQHLLHKRVVTGCNSCSAAAADKFGRMLSATHFRSEHRGASGCMTRGTLPLLPAELGARWWQGVSTFATDVAACRAPSGNEKKMRSWVAPLNWTWCM